MACPIPANVQNCPPIAVYQIGYAENFIFRLCDNNGAFYQVIELCSGDPGTPQNYTTSWTPYTPVGTIRDCSGGGGGGGSGFDFNQLVFCDGGNGNQPFISRVLFDESGDLNPDATGTYELDGVTPYTVIGPVAVCGGGGGGGGGGTEYTEGGTVGTITGTAILWRDAGNVVTPVSTVKPLPVSALTLPLPTGAATAANQTSGNTTLTAIDGHVDGIEASLGSLDTKTPALGQAAMAASTPVVIASNQSAIPVSGTFWQATQPISASSLPLPTGAATSAKQDTGNTSLGSLDTKTPALGQAAMAASTPVVIASNQSAIPVSGTFWQATQPISASSLPLPTGAATSANQGTGNTSLGSLDTKLPPQGQAAMAASLPVVIANNQSAVPVSGTFWQTTQPVSLASVPLPTGAATAANQATTNATLTTIDGHVDGLEASTVSIDTKLTGVATAANQGSMITSLSNLDGKLPTTLGQKAMAASLAVTVASDQGDLSVKLKKSPTSAITSVGGSATNVTLLASNVNRLGATVYNDSAAILYLKLGATTTTSSFTLQIAPSGYYEVPFNYSGIIDGLWASATGNARITELS